MPLRPIVQYLFANKWSVWCRAWDGFRNFKYFLQWQHLLVLSYSFALHIVAIAVTVAVVVVNVFFDVIKRSFSTRYCIVVSNCIQQRKKYVFHIISEMLHHYLVRKSKKKKNLKSKMLLFVSLAFTYVGVIRLFVRSFVHYSFIDIYQIEMHHNSYIKTILRVLRETATA